MMERLMARAEAAGRGARRRRIEQIAARFREAGVTTVTDLETVRCSGRGLARRWLSDPLLRFASRNLR